ncbi:MAG: hypothetical protein SFW07_02700, partial [Gammaproteobacteria bacterium]|nr:hypothetical protein [Gammaproteobacteria bacterium]
MNSTLSDLVPLVNAIEGIDGENDMTLEYDEPILAEKDELDGKNEDFQWVKRDLLELNLRSTASQQDIIRRSTPKFTDSNSGPDRKAIRDAGAETILDFFQLFFTNSILEAFVAASNSYAKKFISGWERDLKLPEFKAFLAIVVSFGFMRYSERSMAFEQGVFGNFFIRNLMTLRRFNQILRSWH